MGSNPLFEHVNQGLRDLRAHGAQGHLHDERKRLAAEYRGFSVAQKRQRLNEYRVVQRVHVQARSANDEAAAVEGMQDRCCQQL
jgi:hypothetical protein